jgi:hypothetical protein
MRVSVLAVTAALVAASSGSAAGGSDPWHKLRRPLHVPRIDEGAPCPVTPRRKVSPEWGLAQGAGPIYPRDGYPSFAFVYPPRPHQLFYGSEWGGNKILWVSRPGFRGRVLVRGRQLDGPHGLGFGAALRPASELRFTVDGDPRWNAPSTTRLRAGGCYAWQIDGATFSRVIIFRAVIVP